MSTVDYYIEQLNTIQAAKQDSPLAPVRKSALDTFTNMGFPTSRNEEWKYTRIGSIFKKEFRLQNEDITSFNQSSIDAVRLPGHENANELVFVNGRYSEEFSKIISEEIIVTSLEAAASGEYADIVNTHFNSSSKYLKDGINALNAAYAQGVFIYVPKAKAVTHPVYIYNIVDAVADAVCALPRCLVYVSEAAEVSFVETYATLGASESITNQVTEIVVAENANVSYCKIQNDNSKASQVSTTHIHQVGKSYAETVTISLDGGIVRNNLNIVMGAAHSEAHMYGLYFQNGESHIDNHTIVDNVMPHCQSNELYKGILNDRSTGVFNGRIYVRQDAQKTNAFQSNKNILLGENATVNTQPQLEIFADDVKCSHGCTVGSLDEEGIFYLQSRGIPKEVAMSLLLQGFALDILEKIKIEHIRAYVQELIAARLTTQI